MEYKPIDLKWYRILTYHYFYINSSSYTAAQYLKNQGNIKSVYIIGEEGLADEIKEVGIEVHGLEDNHHYDFSVSDIDINSEVDAVVSGFDKLLNFTKLSKATVYLQNPKCRFISCEKYINITYL